MQLKLCFNSTGRNCVVQNLEEEPGIKLFDYSGGKVHLTVAEVLMLEYARRISKLYDEAEKSIGILLHKAFRSNKRIIYGYLQEKL